MKLLLVEDDVPLRKRLKASFKKAGFVIDIAVNGIDAEYLGNEILYDVVILDIGLPKKSGLEVLQTWRKNNRYFPVIILTARDAWYERVDGLRAGADDYLGKPFHFEELLLRIQALMRRSEYKSVPHLKIGDFLLNQEKQTLINDDVIIELTKVEFRLLHYFLSHPETILSKSRLIEQVYENDADKNSNVIEVYINRLRKKIGHNMISTRRGQGYIFHNSVDS